ncbi:MAG: 1-deoxy-D-xylulose-5-phosphate reductoisomerase [Solirubrobacteraceae bacterium]
MARRLVVLGATGSIGVQALDVVRGSEGELELVGLSAHSGWESLVQQATAHGVRRIALADPAAAQAATDAWPAGEVLSGPDGVARLAGEAGCDLVLNAIVGSAGLRATVAALGDGVDLALANKESLVVGGELVMKLAQGTGARIIPVDSEHSALHQLLAGAEPGTVDRLIVTASGGPFRGRSRAALAEVSVEQALAHPTWAMGAKITIDSATLMNKGLEVIEAHHLFGVAYEQIEVVVHPQSIIHGMVALCDGATLAHLGYPDMRVPIAYALHHPQRVELPLRALDLVEVGALSFEAPDLETFACLPLARAAGIAGGTAPCTLNAANEVAVHAFLSGGLSFLGIAGVIERTLAHLPAQPAGSFDALVDADLEARAYAAQEISRLHAP